MSGHSKWHSIKYKKGAADAKRGKIFTKHAKLVALAAAEGGADPEMNPGLRSAIANAKAVNMPNSNIEKAVKKGAGLDKEGVRLEEIMYEALGPAGTAFYIQVITDNKNRSFASLKLVLNKNGGQLADAGSVGWMFDRKGLIIVKKGLKNADEAELEIIDAGAEDLSLDNDIFEIKTKPEELMLVRDNLEKVGFEIESAELSFLPKNVVKVDEVSAVKKVLKLAEFLEDEEDVGNIFSNFDIDEELMEEAIG